MIHCMNIRASASSVISFLLTVSFFSAAGISSSAEVDKTATIQVPSLAQVPPELESAFGGQRQKLKEERRPLDIRKANFKVNCAGKSAQDAECNKEQKALVNEYNQW